MDTAGFTMGAIRYGGARHPFRASLPRRVLRALPHHEPEVAARLAAAAARGDDGELPGAVAEVLPAPRRGWRITTQDVKDFLIAYTACLLAVTTFLG